MDEAEEIKAEPDDSTNWKQTGLPRDQVRKEWEALSQETRPGWAQFVKTKREIYERAQKRHLFEKELEGFKGVKITIPTDSLSHWLAESVTKPLKVMDGAKPGHKSLLYRLTPQEREELESKWKAWREKVIKA